MRTELLTQIAPENALLTRLKPVMRRASAAVIGIAFIQRQGLKHLFACARPLLDADRHVEMFTSGYLGITQVGALEDLLKLCRQYPSLTVRFNLGDRFHAKYIYLRQPARRYCLFVGSSNISVAGLAGLGELNVQIRGQDADPVGRSIGIVTENLRKDRTFRKLTPDVIDEYRRTLPGLRGRRRRPRRQGRTVAGQLPSLQSMPVYVARSSFTKSEEAGIHKAHAGWKDFIDWVGPVRSLDRGDHYLDIDARERRRTFTVPRYLEHDRVRGVGVIAHVRPGRSMPLERLAKKLELRQKTLVDSKRLDVYAIAILKRAFPKAFG
jgi:HKD family nuclease